MNPADLTLSPLQSSRPLSTPQTSSAQKSATKLLVPRVDLEPLYTALKTALADAWPEYKTALNHFLLGALNQAELAWVLQPLLLRPAVPGPAVAPPSAAAAVGLTDSGKGVGGSVLYLHNALITALYANCIRDAPGTEVAPWVVAVDRPAGGGKAGGGGGLGAQGDEAEERLKREVMSLGARDRRRIKALKVEEGGAKLGAGAGMEGLAEMRGYQDALAVKAPSAADVAAAAAGGGGSAGGVGRMSYELESRRRYAQPLASETLEFPTLPDLHARIEPIAAEEGLAGSTQSTVQACADLVEQAAEVYLKELLGSLRSHVRANGEGCIQPAAFRRQVQREEEEVEHGVVARNAAGLLPVEIDMLGRQKPVGMEDLRLAVLNGDLFLRQDKFLSQRVWLDRFPREWEDEGNGLVVDGGFGGRKVGGQVGDEMEVDWQGAASASYAELEGVLDDCLAVG
ncbi:hypothetical protein B0A50_05200 [Salinomyces thailandicus]|uniref:Transcriptional co-activator n=1 Tax=Salinomyces thailandicus TaxID=706561 RepID=A0A4V5N5Y0_9PEZI|nr:hypothetical protein B0A50_05200 [Salinomyces thailandica]